MNVLVSGLRQHLARRLSSVLQHVADRGASGVLGDVALLAIAIAPLWLCRNSSTSSASRIALCVGAACLVAAFDRMLWQRLTACAPLRRLSAYALGLSVAFMLLRRLLGARWGMIDDHEIADALITGRADTLKGLWHTLSSHREVAAPPWTYPRYRPSYYTLRFIETYLWGFETWRWYLSRIVLLGVSFALSWQALLVVMGPTQASLSLLFALSAPFWGDVFCRLGPSEQYALLGCAAFCYGASASLRALSAGEAPRLKHWLLAALGSMLASGSKENFVFVPALLALLSGVAAYRRKLSAAPAALSALALVYAGWVVAVVVVSVRRHGATVYGKPAGLTSAPELVLDATLSLIDQCGAAITLAACGMLAGFLYRRTPQVGRRFAALALAIVLCCGIYGLQAIVYKGNIRASMRYAFPAGVLATLIVSAAYAALRSQTNASLGASRATFAVDAAVLSAATYLVASEGFRDLKQAAAQTVVQTRHFSDQIAHMADSLRAAPERPLLFTVGLPDRDLEPLVSTRIFLDYYGVTNPIYVSVEPSASGRAEAVLRDWSKHGLWDWRGDEGLRGRPGKFQPLSALPKSVPAFGVALSSALPPEVTPLALF